MKKIIIFTLIMLLSINGISAYTVSESGYFLNYELYDNQERKYVKNCFNCNLPIRIEYNTRPLLSPINEIDLKAALSHIIDEKIGTGQYTIEGIEVLKTMEIEKPYLECNYKDDQLPNGTWIKNKTDCDLKYKLETVNKWLPLTSEKLKYQDEIIINIKGKTKPETDKRLSVDIVPRLSIEGKDLYFDKLAWWNATFPNKMLMNCTLLDDGLHVAVNKTNFTISGSVKVVWSYCSGNGTAVYFINATAFVIANDTEQLPFCVEYGTGTSYKCAEVFPNHEMVIPYEENAGVAADDYSVFDNDVTLSNANLWTGGLFGYGVGNFQTLSEYVDSNELLDNTMNISDYSFNIWFKTTDITPAALEYIFDFRGDLGWLNCYIDNAPAGDIVCNRRTSDDVNRLLYAGVGNYTQDNWTLLTFTYNTISGSKLYINGVLTDTDAATGQADTAVGNSDNIGSKTDGLGNFLDGYSDMFIFWNTTMTATEINQTFQNALGEVNGFGELLMPILTTTTTSTTTTTTAPANDTGIWRLIIVSDKNIFNEETEIYVYQNSSNVTRYIKTMQLGNRTTLSGNVTYVMVLRQGYIIETADQLFGIKENMLYFIAILVIVILIIILIGYYLWRGK